MAYESRQAWIDAVRQSVDIVEVVGRHVALKRKGRHWWGICPFHAEKTPSFSVDAQQQLFYCFGCHEGGTVFTFLMRLEGREFLDVVESLGEAAGIARMDQEDHDPYGRLRAVLEWSHEYFHESFRRNAEHLYDYLDGRGVDRPMVDRFQLGFAPDSWHGLTDLLRRRGVAVEDMVQAGVVVRRDDGGAYDRWRNRLMFPIWDKDGRIVAFGGRALNPGQDPKYINSPQTPLFHKGRLLYGGHLARPSWRKGERALIVEGYFDVVACHQAGLTQAVGQLGTALTDDHARFLVRYTQEVDLLLDQDSAGQEAMRRAFLSLSAFGLRVNVVTLPADVKDPSELVQKRGVDALVKQIQQRVPYVQHEIEQVGQLGGLVNPRRQAEIVDTLKPLIRAVQDPVEQAGYREMLAKTLRIHPQILSQSLRSAQEVRHTIGKNRHNMEVTAPARRGQPIDVWLLAALMKHPDQVERVKEAVPNWAAQERIRAVLDDIETGQVAEPDQWSSRWADPEVGSLYAAIWQNQEPDGGTEVIEDLIRALQQDSALRRYAEIRELARQGDLSPDLLEEVKQLGPQLERYQFRKEG